MTNLSPIDNTGTTSPPGVNTALIKKIKQAKQTYANSLNITAHSKVNKHYKSTDPGNNKHSLSDISCKCGNRYGFMYLHNEITCQICRLKRRSTRQSKRVLKAIAKTRRIPSRRKNSCTINHSPQNITLKNKFHILRLDNTSSNSNQITLDKYDPSISDITIGGNDMNIPLRRSSDLSHMGDSKQRKTRKTQWDTPMPRTYAPIESSNIRYWNIPYKRKR